MIHFFVTVIKQKSALAIWELKEMLCCKYIDIMYYGKKKKLKHYGTAFLYFESL